MLELTVLKALPELWFLFSFWLFKEHGEHWKTIGEVMLHSKEKNKYQNLVDEHLRQHAQMNATELSSVEPQDSKSDSHPATNFTSSQERRSTSDVIKLDSDIFDRYNDVGDLMSKNLKEETSEDTKEDEERSSLELDADSLPHSVPHAIPHSAHAFNQKLCSPTRHAQPREFPNRQMYIYVVADPTDMRVELDSLRVNVWPHLRHICHIQGFALKIIDHSAETDIDPAPWLNMDSEEKHEALRNHLSRRKEQRNFINNIILLSTQSVGPVPQLPQALCHSTVKHLTKAALEEITTLKADVEILSEKLPGYDPTQASRRNLATQEQISSLLISPVSDAKKDPSHWSRLQTQSSTITTAQLAIIEETLKQKKELIGVIHPGPLSRWYKPNGNEGESGKNLFYLQPIRTVLPDIDRYEEDARRQAALGCWLSDTHRIRCLLFRYLNWPRTSSAGRRSREGGVLNMPRASSSVASSSTQLSKAFSFEDENLMEKSVLEEEVEAILSSGEKNEDCLVIVRSHQQEPSELAYERRSVNSRAMSLDSWGMQTGSSSVITDQVNPVKYIFLHVPFEESKNRAGFLVESSRLQVPQFNQVYQEVVYSTPLNIEDQILRKRPPLDPTGCPDHTGYVEEFCRTVRSQMSKSLKLEMARRLEEESKRRLLLATEQEEPAIWSLEYELAAHWEACRELSKEFICRRDTLEEIFEFITCDAEKKRQTCKTSSGNFFLITVHGESGSGKSVLLAKLAELLKESCTDEITPRVIFRTVGSSTLSMNLLRTLHYLCLELSAKMNALTIATNYDGLQNAVYHALIQATFEQEVSRPLVVILDGIENMEDFIQRREFFPISWLPTEWLQRHPYLNSDVYLVISGSSAADNEPFKGFGGLMDLLTFKDYQSQSSHLLWKDIHLKPLNQWDIEACLDVWFDSNEVLSVLDTWPSDCGLNTLQPIQLRILAHLIQLGEFRWQAQKTKDLTTSALLHTWFLRAEKDYGRQRVETTIRHLLCSRRGLTDEEVIGLGRKTMEGRQKRHTSARLGRKLSLQTLTPNPVPSSAYTCPAITSHWWASFSRQRLTPVSMIRPCRDLPEGLNRNWYLANQITQHVLNIRYLGSKVRKGFHLMQAAWFTDCFRDQTILSALQKKSTNVNSTWRWVHELPYHLGKSASQQRLLGECIFNSRWLQGLVQSDFSSHGNRCHIDLVVNEIVSSLCYLWDDKLKAQVEEMPKNAFENTCTIKFLDKRTKATLQLLSEHTDLIWILTAMCFWKPHLERDPELLCTLLNTHYSEYSEEEDSMTGVVARGESEEEGSDSNYHNSKPNGKYRLSELLNQFNAKIPNGTLKPVNFSTLFKVSSLDQLATGLISATADSCLTGSQTSSQVTALAYNSRGDQLAIGIRNVEQHIAHVEIWDMLTKTIVRCQSLSVGTADTVGQLMWIGREAIIITETPSQRITVLPVNSPTGNNDVFYTLSEGVNDKMKGQDSLVIRTAETDSPGVTLILVLSLGVYRMNIWLWDLQNIHYLAGPFSLLDDKVWSSVSQQVPGGVRFASLPSAIQTSEAMLAAIVRNSALQFVFAERGESTARLHSIEFSPKNWEVHFTKPLNRKILRCPTAGTRLIAAAITRQGTIVLASRSPTADERNSEIVGCLDLFDLSTGSFQSRIEASSAVFSFTESSLGGSGVLRTTITPQLHVFLSDDGTNAITVSHAPGGKFKSASMEFVVWNLINRSHRNLAFEHLIPQITHELTNLPIPVSVGYCNVNKISVCIPFNDKAKSQIWHCDPLRATTVPVTKAKIRLRGMKIFGCLRNGHSDSEDLKYLCRHLDGDVYLGITTIKAEQGDPKPESAHIIVTPYETKQWASTDRFVMQDQLLIVLGKLEYSEVVEECREVFQQMDIFEFSKGDSLGFQLEHIRHLTDVFIIPCNLHEYIIWKRSYLVGMDECQTHFVAWSLNNGELVWRMKPNFALFSGWQPTVEIHKSDTNTNAVMRAFSAEETTGTSEGVANPRLENYMINSDQTVMIANYGLPYLCVFLLAEQKHVGNLSEDYAHPNRTRRVEAELSTQSMSLASISSDGCWFVHSEFSREEGSSCLTVWYLGDIHTSITARKYEVDWRRKRLTNQSGLVAMTIGGPDGSVVAARLGGGILVWNLCKSKEPRQLHHSNRLLYTTETPPLLQVSADAIRIVAATGLPRTQVSAWIIHNEYDTLMGHVFCENNIKELVLGFKDEYIALRTENIELPLLIWPRWSSALTSGNVNVKKRF
ncbi:unnamed protein product [Calicophoron daubneyi]|uniref:NACHT domain-containing protein n=1 Tax=Calicophoron daubneyi TaxID=300641 RepID=A0AAV2TDC0_CALDB